MAGQDETVVVEPLFVSDHTTTYATEVWISPKALKRVNKDRKRHGAEHKRLLASVREYARKGFQAFTGEQCPIRREWDGVYRIGLPSDLFRLIGFFEGEYREFMIITAFRKSGQKLNASQKTEINDVATIRKTRRWRRSDGR